MAVDAFIIGGDEFYNRIVTEVRLCHHFPGNEPSYNDKYGDILAGMSATTITTVPFYEFSLVGSHM